MTILRTYTLSVILALQAAFLLAPAAFGQTRPAQAQARANGQKGQQPPDNHPGEQLLDKLTRMTPEERDQALSRLAPARRAQLEQKIRSFQQLPMALQERTLDRLERLNRLPPQKQNQVRRSMKQFADLPEDRKMAINLELRHMSAMPDDERRSYMNTEEFRNRYSPAEQQMMSNLAEVLPARD
jgi:hypothetical protein